jgi:hypothetical protein
VRTRFLLVVIALAAAALPAGPAAAAPTKGKDFSMSVQPAAAGVTYDSPVADGSAEDFAITLTNSTGTQALGSANVTVPTGITITDRNGNGGTGQTIEFRNLAIPAGTSRTLVVGLRMPCAGTYAWDVNAKQSNDYSGTGNDLNYSGAKPVTTIQGTCKLRFVTQPADATIIQPISTQPFTAPSADNVITIEAVDGRPSPAVLDWFNGSVRLTSNPNGFFSTVNAIAGVAKFSDLSIPVSDNYTLVPTAPSDAGFTGSASNSFQVVDKTASCTTNGCIVQALKGTKSETSLSGANVSGSGLAVLSLSLGVDSLSSAGCKGKYTPHGSSPDYYEFRLFGVEADMTATLQYPGANKPSLLDVCFAAPGPPFHAKDGSLAPAFDYDGDGPSTIGFAALLPNCTSKTPSEPCVLGRNGLPMGGSQITYYVPSAWSGDPRMH